MNSRSASRRFATLMISTVIATLGLPLDRATAIEAAGPPLGSGQVLSIDAARFQARRSAGDRSAHRVVRAADGAVQDQTRAVEWVSLNPEIAQVTPKGRVVPRSERGRDDHRAPRQPRSATPTYKVAGMDRPSPVSFRRDVIPAFSQASCNMGACHGTPTGKGGFRLSLRGYLPDQDFGILSREAGGPANQPDRPGDQPDLTQASGRSTA